MTPSSGGLHGAYLKSDIIEQCGRQRLRNALSSGELRVRWPGVVIDAKRELDPWTNAAAALLAVGDWAVLSHTTAAYLQGCTSVDPVKTHALVPYGVAARSRQGLVVHRGGYEACDVVRCEGLRMLRLDRALVDVLCAADPAAALAVTDEALRAAGSAGESFRAIVRERVEIRPDRRGTVRAAKLLELASPRAESPAESWLRLIIFDSGLPLPVVNYSLLGLDGRELFRLDLAWVELRICLEYDGYAAHAGREERDESREQELRRRGWIVIRASRADLSDPSRMLRELRNAFASRGRTW